MTPSTSPADVGSEELSIGLLGVIGPLRRMLRRRVRDDWPLEPLPAAQVELLRLVSEQPGVGVGEAAARLHLAANTVSTLVGQLGSAGLVLTPAADARIAAWRERRVVAARRALEALSADDRVRLHAALPALERLVEELAT